MILTDLKIDLSSLADPVKQYPNLFGNSVFLAKFPYALPNIAVASLLLIVSIFAFLFMKETHSKNNVRDIGIRLREFIFHKIKLIFRIWFRKKSGSRARRWTNVPASEVIELSSDHEETLYSTHYQNENREPESLSPATQHTSRPNYQYHQRVNSVSAIVPNATKSPRIPFRDIFTKQVILNMFVFSGLALHTFTFDQLFSLLCATEIQDGGMGMSPRQIGVALSLAGVMAMVLQFTLFPWGHKKFGGVFCLRIVLGMYSILYFVPSSRRELLTQCIPFLPKFIEHEKFDDSPNVWSGIILVLLVKVIASVFAFPICAILIMQSSPSREILGTVNGANQALASLGRAIGPAVAGIIYSRSLEVMKPWIVWRYGLCAFAIVVWIGSLFLSDEIHLPDAKTYLLLSNTDQDEGNAEENIDHESVLEAAENIS